MKDKLIKFLNLIFAPRVTINNIEVDSKDFPTKNLNELWEQQEKLFDKAIELMDKAAKIKKK